MPEGCEIHKISKDLQDLITGYTLTSLTADPRLKASNLHLVQCPTTITSVTAHGKKVVFHLTRGTLVSSLGMVGRYTLEHSSYAICTLQLTSPQGAPLTLYYQDHRYFGSLLYYDLPFDCIKGNFGRDLITDPPSATEWLNTMRSYKRRNICAILLDTEHYNSVGNYIKSEALYLARISPHRRIDEISNDELLALRTAVLEVLTNSLAKGGLTIKDFWSLHGERGMYQPLVYNQKRDTEGREIHYEKIGGRGTYWVPEIQK